MRIKDAKQRKEYEEKMNRSKEGIEPEIVEEIKKDSEKLETIGKAKIGDKVLKTPDEQIDVMLKTMELRVITLKIMLETIKDKDLKEKLICKVHKSMEKIEKILSKII